MFGFVRLVSENVYRVLQSLAFLLLREESRKQFVDLAEGVIHTPVDLSQRDIVEAARHSGEQLSLGCVYLAHFRRVGGAEPGHFSRSLQTLVQLILQVNVRVPVDKPGLVELVKRLLYPLTFLRVGTS